MTPHDHLRLLRRFDRTFHLRPLIRELMTPQTRVLDAGCGLGILSLWAAQAGARSVVAVDRDDLTPARQLAQDNRLDERIEFHQTDLFELLDQHPEYRNSFDILIAMVYLNDPRRDEEQSNLVSKLKSQFLKPGGTLLPNRVEYHAAVCEWAEQDWPTYSAVQSAHLREIELRYGLLMPSLERRLNGNVDKLAFPHRDERGRIACPAGRLLADFQPAFEVNYDRDAVAYPPSLEFKIARPGIAHGVLWQQRLMFNERLIFWNESWSWIESPRFWQAGDHCAAELNQHWRATSRVELSLCRP